MDTSDKWFTLDNRIGAISGSRGREFKSRQPDSLNDLVRRLILLLAPLGFMIVITSAHLFAHLFSSQRFAQRV